MTELRAVPIGGLKTSRRKGGQSPAVVMRMKKGDPDYQSALRKDKASGHEECVQGTPSMLQSKRRLLYGSKMKQRHV
jgi:hypothetical protein